MKYLMMWCRSNYLLYIVKRQRIRSLIILLLVLCILVLTFNVYPFVVSPANTLFFNSISKFEAKREIRQIDEKTLRKQVCVDSSNEMIIKPLDYRNLTVKKFLKNYKNPCFFEKMTVEENEKVRTKQVLRCVPYFFIAGFPKAGTTDLWHRLLNHPEVVAEHIKEPMYLNRKRKGSSFTEVASNYIKIYDKTAKAIQNLTLKHSPDEKMPYHYAITGEGSVDTSFDNANWRKFPGNEKCTEPVITQPHYVHRINPNIKVILMIRNPTERLYSDYIFEARWVKYNTSRQDFHNLVVESLARFIECTRSSTIRGCAYSFKESFKVRLRIGLYYIFIEDWLRVIKPGNVLVLNSESTMGPRKFEVYRQVCKFLNIRPLTVAEEETLYKSKPINSRSEPEKGIGDMFNETRKLIDAFYKPFNEELLKFNIL